jgi:hypothetical protein
MSSSNFALSSTAVILSRSEGSPGDGPLPFNHFVIAYEAGPHSGLDRSAPR